MKSKIITVVLCLTILGWANSTECTGKNLKLFEHHIQEANSAETIDDAINHLQKALEYCNSHYIKALYYYLKALTTKNSDKKTAVRFLKEAYKNLQLSPYTEEKRKLSILLNHLKKELLP